VIFSGSSVLLFLSSLKRNIMNNNVMHTRVQVDQSIVANLQEVKETIAVNFGKQSVRSFGIQDMWNIRRNAKLATLRIRK
jgi:hypothetical protein